MAVIPVDIAGRPYEVRVGAGLLAELVENCRGRLRKPGVAIVTDANGAEARADVLDAPGRQAAFALRVQHRLHVLGREFR